MAKAKDTLWMEKAFSKNKGKLHRETGTPQGEKIPQKKLAAASKRANKTGNTTLKREVNLAERGKAAAKKR